MGIPRLISGEDFFLVNDPLKVNFKKLSFFDPPYKKGLPTLSYVYDNNIFFYVVTNCAFD